MGLGTSAQALCTAARRRAASAFARRVRQEMHVQRLQSAFICASSSLCNPLDVVAHAAVLSGRTARVFACGRSAAPSNGTALARFTCFILTHQGLLNARLDVVQRVRSNDLRNLCRCRMYLGQTLSDFISMHRGSVSCTSHETGLRTLGRAPCAPLLRLLCPAVACSCVCVWCQLHLCGANCIA